MSLFKLLITDLEATCYEEHNKPKDFFSEIIEIGAILLNARNKISEKEYQTFVKPVLFPVSEFCTQLTSITSEHVSKAPHISQAIYGYKPLYNKNDTVLASWGGYDARQIKRQCNRFSIPYPFEQKHINIKEAFARFYNATQGKNYPAKGVGMDSALRALKIPLDGTHHRAIDDTRNIAKIVVKMIEDGWDFTEDIKNPFKKN